MYKITQLESMQFGELKEIATKLNIESESKIDKKKLIHEILNKQATVRMASPFKENSFVRKKSNAQGSILEKLDGEKAQKETEDRASRVVYKRSRINNSEDDSLKFSAGADKLNLKIKRREGLQFSNKHEGLSNTNNLEEKKNTYYSSNGAGDKSGVSNDQEKKKIIHHEDKKVGYSNNLEEKKDVAPNNNSQKNYKDEESENGEMRVVTGLLEVMQEGFGFLRYQSENYFPSSEDVYVSQSHIKSLGLRTGDTISGTARPPKNAERYDSLYKIETVNGLDRDQVSNRVSFDKLCPIFPEESLNLFIDKNEYSTRLMSMFSPIGKGQRGMIVAPPKTGKTILLEHIAMAIAKNHPDIHLIALLICERPEEVTHMSRVVKGEVVASTFDEHPERQVRLANIVLEKAKRLVESGKDVVILMDSLTRLVRAYNAVNPSSGKVLSGGLDINALYKPKSFFGAARNIENGGSCTILATTVIETGSKMDEVIFEELKGTGNMELQLDRKLSNRRIYPAINILASGTRNENKLLTPQEIKKVWMLRRYMSDMNSIEAMEFLLAKIKNTSSNDEFLDNINDAEIEGY